MLILELPDARILFLMLSALVIIIAILANRTKPPKPPSKDL